MTIEWKSWTPEAFDEADDAGKFILLSISAVWCHWCHVMDNTTYKDEKSLELINKYCVPIRVDVDKNPDITDRYHMGGFPTTVLLTSNGDLIGGGTYINPDQFVDIIERLAKTVEETKTLSVMDSFAKRLNYLEHVEPATKLPEDLVKKFVEASKPGYDKHHGGWGSPNKFPMPDLVRLCKLAGEDEMVKQTLFGLAKLHDDKEGGFFRYSTKEDWSAPHYEKMLEGNAELISLFADEEEHKEILDKTINYVLTTLNGKAFFGSQDADEAYYKGDRSGTPPKVDKTIYTDLNAMMISALLKTNNKEAHKVALEALDFISKEEHHFYTPEPSGEIFFRDYAYLIQALIDAAEQTKESNYMEKAEKLTKKTLDIFWDDARGGFNDRVKSVEDIGFLKQSIHNIKENSIMALNLHRLATAKKDKNLAQRAKTTLLRFGNHYARYAQDAATYALVVHKVLS